MKKIGFIFFSLFFVITGLSQNSFRTIFDDADLLVEPLELVNTTASDISPALVGRELYFSSVPEKYFNNRMLERKNIAFYSTYSVLLNNDGRALSAGKEVLGFGGGKFHEGPVTYCAATGELFVTLSNIINPDTVRKVFPLEYIRLRLVVMKKFGDEWKITEELPFNNDKFHFAHPAVSVTGDTLVFSSDMDSVSFGKSDLFMSIRTNGVWSVPQNLGNIINTEGNEMFPSFLPNGLLAFASDGHPGAMGGLDIWYTNFPGSVKITGFGDKINSASDDFGLIINPDGKTGYFSSNRPGKGSDDIYLLYINSLYLTYKGRVIDDETSQPVKGSIVKISDCDGKIIEEVHSDLHGNFEFKGNKNDCLIVEVFHDGYKPERKEITGTNDFELRIKKQETYLTIKIIDKESGEELSDARLDVSVRNREPVNIQSRGNHFRLKIDNSSNYIVNAARDGFFPVKLEYSGIGKTPGEYMFEIPLEKIVPGKQFLVEDLYYDLDKYNIRPDAAIVLDRLVKVLNENPEIRIELGSHTDSRGSSSYNLKLSQNRSNSAVTYLISMGIDSRRLIAKGYGETQLVNNCADGVTCTEQEHQANRRTVIKILDTDD